MLMQVGTFAQFGVLLAQPQHSRRFRYQSGPAVNTPPSSGRVPSGFDFAAPPDPPDVNVPSFWCEYQEGCKRATKEDGLVLDLMPPRLYC